MIWFGRLFFGRCGTVCQAFAPFELSGF